MYIGVLLHPGADAQQLYEWSCSPLDTSTGSYTLPNLGYGGHQDVASNFGNLEPSESDRVDVYRIPSTLNCNGTVSSLDYCYGGLIQSNSMINYGTEYHLFTLLIFEQNGLTFRITDLLDVFSTPTRQICTDRLLSQFEQHFRFCCSTLQHEAIFSLPAANFAFGILPRSLVSQIRYIVRQLPQFRVERYSFSTSLLGTPAVGDTFTLTGDDAVVRTDRALRLLQFGISK